MKSVMLGAMEVPLFANHAALEPVLPEIAERVRSSLESGRYILGEQVSSFESEFASYLGARHCVGLNSGTDALVIGLRALGVRPGDEVVVPAITFFATAEAVVNAGARPVFADIDASTWCLSAASVEPVLSERTAAIIPVHLFGNPAPMEGLTELARDHDLRLLEDAAQAAGARLDGHMAGTWGDAGAFSFYPSKNLPGVGDGGALVTDDEEVAALCRRLRNHGSTDKQLHTEVGHNSRLDELQAAALRVQLPYLDRWNAARRAAAAAYADAGLGELVRLPTEAPGAEHVYHLYVTGTERRDHLREALQRAGIGARPYYSTPLYRQPALEEFAPSSPLQASERFAAEALALPMGPSLSAEQVEAVVTAARKALTS
jgi:dTDP-4-amino-4,6-dideoxygalactose transaminase